MSQSCTLPLIRCLLHFTLVWLDQVLCGFARTDHTVLEMLESSRMGFHAASKHFACITEGRINQKKPFSHVQGNIIATIPKACDPSRASKDLATTVYSVPWGFYRKDRPKTLIRWGGEDATMSDLPSALVSVQTATVELSRCIWSCLVSSHRSCACIRALRFYAS